MVEPKTVRLLVGVSGRVEGFRNGIPVLTRPAAGADTYGPADCVVTNTEAEACDDCPPGYHVWDVEEGTVGTAAGDGVLQLHRRDVDGRRRRPRLRPALLLLKWLAGPPERFNY